MNEYYNGAKALLDNNPVGWIIRAFALKPKDVEKRAWQVIDTILRLLAISLHPTMKTVARIDVWIPMDPSRKDHDCGLLKAALIAKLKELGIRGVDVHTLERGDLYCRLLNRAVALQVSKGCKYSGIVSTEMRSNITPDNMAKMYNALHEGALVTCLALGAIRDLVKAGYVMNHCAIWKNIDLMENGGFDLIAEQRRLDDPKRHPIFAAGDGSPSNSTSATCHYDRGGMEQMAVLLRLWQVWVQGENPKPFIAPIVVEDGVWQSPDPEEEQHLYLRFVNMLGTKWARMLAWAKALDLPIGCIPQCVMPKYRS